MIARQPFGSGLRFGLLWPFFVLPPEARVGGERQQEGGPRNRPGFNITTTNIPAEVLPDRPHHGPGYDGIPTTSFSDVANTTCVSSGLIYTAKNKRRQLVRTVAAHTPYGG